MATTAIKKNKLSSAQIDELIRLRWYLKWTDLEICRFHQYYRNLIMDAEILVAALSRVIDESIDASWANWFDESLILMNRKYGIEERDPKEYMEFPGGFGLLKPREKHRTPLHELTGSDDE